MAIQQLPIFVYGTLRTGQGNYRRFLEGETIAEYPATLPNHKMYSLGIAYITDSKTGCVVGDLMFLEPSTYQKVLANLDGLEGYREKDPHSHYLRVKRTAQYTDKTGRLQNVECWVYHGGEYALRRMKEENLVEGGDWLAHKKLAWR
jgi:gamma-glutamylcyclotransferase (GGCT)/AIG2-like uncharacterized protein YtfP